MAGLTCPHVRHRGIFLKEVLHEFGKYDMFRFKFTVLKFAFLTAVLSMLPLAPLVVPNAAPQEPVLQKSIQNANAEAEAPVRNLAHEATGRYLPKRVKNSRIH